MNAIDEIVQDSLREEQQGDFWVALRILQKSIKQFPAESTYLLSEIAELFYRHNYHLDSIRTLIQCYRKTKLMEIKELLLYRYYQPNQKRFQDHYRDNIDLLNHYAFFYGSKFEEFEFIKEKIIWLDDEFIIYICDDDIQTFSFSKKFFTDVNSGDVVLLTNCFNLEEIKQLEQITYMPFPLWIKIPFCLYYEPEIWQLFVQVISVKDLLKKERFVFLIGENNLTDFLWNRQNFLPKRIDNDLDKVVNLIQKISDERQLEEQHALRELFSYYRENKERIIERIKNGKIRIYFMTSRFSRVIQYHTRDCQLACQELGWETKLLIEESDICRIFDKYIKMNEFKPDIIFCIDYFHFQQKFMFPELVWVTWIQDPLPVIMDPKTPAKLTEKDFVIQCEEGKEEKNIYAKCNTIHTIFPTNEKIYRPYILSTEEKDKYECDICLVCHASNFSKAVKDLLVQLPDHLKDIIKKIAEKYFILCYEEKELFTLREHKVFIENELQQKEYIVDGDMIEFISNEFYFKLKIRALRVILVKWLLEAGYKRIKLWGNEWLEQAEFQAYAMGAAENGKTLSKILQASKIVLGNNAHLTAAARVGETILSGGFYLSNYLPSQHDSVNIRNVLQEDEEIKFFYNRKDLLNKVLYYLSNEEDRQKIIKKGRKKALEVMTFTELMKKVIKEIKQKI